MDWTEGRINDLWTLVGLKLNDKIINCS
jgi:hypothetical protein